MKKPNILFFFPDQMRADWTELNPEIPMRTPNLRKLANRGVHFSNAYTPSPLCSPARSCMAVGKEYDKVDIINNGQNHPFDDPTFYELLRDKGGYHTMTCGKLDLRHPEHTYGRDGKHIVNGIDYMKKWGFSYGIETGGKLNGARTWRNEREKIGPYIAYLDEKGLAEKYAYGIQDRSYKDAQSSPLIAENYGDNWIGRSGIKMLRDAPKDKPWFIQVNFNGPHQPFDPPTSMLEKWENVNFPMPIDHSKYSEQTNQEIRRSYSAMIENIDNWIEKFLAEVEKRGEMENTIVIFASDHGEMLGDHNREKKGVPHQEAVCVPLFISGSGVKELEPIDKPVSLIDLFATILDLAEVKIPKGVDSRSLKPIIEGKKMVETRFIRSGLKHFRVVVEDKFKLVVGFHYSASLWEKLKHTIKNIFTKTKNKKVIFREPVYLFDLENDPKETINLANDRPDVVKKLLENVV